MNVCVCVCAWQGVLASWGLAGGGLGASWVGLVTFASRDVSLFNASSWSLCTGRALHCAGSLYSNKNDMSASQGS